MKKSTRKIIGSILVWGGLGVIAIAGYVLYSQQMPAYNAIGGFTSSQISLTIEVFRNSLYMIGGGIVALLIGGLWGMRK